MPANQFDAVFPARNSTWQQVNNVERRWRQIRREAGLDWITPDDFRRVAEGNPSHERQLGSPDA
jgi:integrase